MLQRQKKFLEVPLCFLRNKTIFDAGVKSSLTGRIRNVVAVFAAFSDFWQLHHFSACVGAAVRAGRVGQLFGPPLRDEWSHLRCLFPGFFYHMFLYTKGLYFLFFRQALPLLRLSAASAVRKNYKSVSLS